MHVSRGMDGGHPKCLHITLHVYVLTYGTSFHVFVLWFLFYLQKFNLTCIQKGYFCQKWLFFSNEINFSCNEISFFYFKLLFQTKVNQNGFSYNQIECQVYSKFQCDTLLLKNPVQHSTEIYLRGYCASIFTDIVLYQLLLLLLLLNVVAVAVS